MFISKKYLKALQTENLAQEKVIKSGEQVIKAQEKVIKELKTQIGQIRHSNNRFQYRFNCIKRIIENGNSLIIKGNKSDTI